METTQLYEFDIPGFTSQRQWCVYIIVGTHKVTGFKNIYVGKVGDNRDGCNTMITRIGNHLSHNKVHAQFRNKIGISNTTEFDYKIHFATFGEYVESNKESRDKINQLEREFNKIVQGKVIGMENLALKNPYKGNGYLSALEKQHRRALLSQDDMNVITILADKALDSSKLKF